MTVICGTISRVTALALKGGALANFQKECQKIPISGSGLEFNPPTSWEEAFVVVFVVVVLNIGAGELEIKHRKTLEIINHYNCQCFKTSLLLFYFYNYGSFTIKWSVGITPISM